MLSQLRAVMHARVKHVCHATHHNDHLSHVLDAREAVVLAAVLRLVPVRSPSWHSLRHLAGAATGSSRQAHSFNEEAPGPL